MNRADRIHAKNSLKHFKVQLRLIWMETGSASTAESFWQYVKAYAEMVLSRMRGKEER